MALLWYQAGASSIEHFAPAGGGWQGTLKESDDPYFVPADLSRAPIHSSCAGQCKDAMPRPESRPNNVPGPGQAPREAYASSKDMMELDSMIMLWLDGAAQRETLQPGSLTPEQLQERILLQGRLANIRTQIGTGAITDSYKSVAAETLKLRRENAGWRRLMPSTEEIYSFGVGVPADAFLTVDTYAQFRSLFNAGYNELSSHAQPNPLLRVRIQQLQVHKEDLRTAEAQSSPNPPPIRMGNARTYLRQMAKADQPLPTLFAFEANPATAQPTMSANPADIVRNLKNLRWQLTLSFAPPTVSAATQARVNAMISQLESAGGSMTPADVEAARSEAASLMSRCGPHAASDSTAAAPVRYDPADMEKRATTLCKQIREAFPREGDAEALGCPPVHVTVKDDPRTVINTVCGRIRYSVPSVSPEQFNCPASMD